MWAVCSPSSPLNLDMQFQLSSAEAHICSHRKPEFCWTASITTEHTAWSGHGFSVMRCNEHLVRVCLSQALVPTKKLQVLNILLLRLWSWRETLDHVYCRYVLDSWPSCAARSFWLKYFVSPLTCATPRVCVLNDATRCKISLVAARRSGQACRRSFKRPKVCTDAAIRASSVTFFQRWWVPLWGTMMKMNANEVMDWKAMCSKSSSKGSIRPTSSHYTCQQVLCICRRSHSENPGQSSQQTAFQSSGMSSARGARQRSWNGRSAESTSDTEETRIRPMPRAPPEGDSCIS